MIAKNEHKPIIVCGFEPLDLLQSIAMLLTQLQKGEAKVENQYKRVVPWEGNHAALKAMAETFQRPPGILNGAAWGSSPSRRCAFANRTAEWDSEQRFDVPGIRVTDPEAAQCGEVASKAF